MKPAPILVIPYATILTVQRFADIVHVWCPECSAAAMAPIASAIVPTDDMVHEEGCPILVRIKRIDRRYEAAGNVRWWKS